MLKLIRNHLLKIVEDLDTGNSNLSDEEEIELLNLVVKLTDKTKRLSKYQACQYLNISRATFDNYVREGKIPKGTHQAGFKELSWSQKDLDSFIKEHKKHY
jgi:predicted DNA-binding transcriptional regulator AlpA